MAYLEHIWPSTGLPYEKILVPPLGARTHSRKTNQRKKKIRTNNHQHTGQLPLQDVTGNNKIRQESKNLMGVRNLLNKRSDYDYDDYDDDDDDDDQECNLQKGSFHPWGENFPSVDYILGT